MPALFPNSVKSVHKWSPYKSAGVVVPQSLGIAKGLEEWVRLQDDVFDVL